MAGAGVVEAGPLPAGGLLPETTGAGLVAAVGAVGEAARPVLAAATAAVVPPVAGAEVDVVGAAPSTPAGRLVAVGAPEAAAGVPAARTVAAAAVRHEAAASVPRAATTEVAVRAEVRAAVVAPRAAAIVAAAVRHVRDGTVPEVPTVRPGAGGAALREDEVPGDEGPIAVVAAVRARAPIAPGVGQVPAVAKAGRGLAAAGRPAIPDVAEGALAPGHLPGQTRLVAAAGRALGGRAIGLLAAAGVDA